MNVFVFLIVLAALGVFLWLVNAKIPMERTIKLLFNIVVIVIIIWWLLKSFNLLDMGSLRM